MERSAKWPTPSPVRRALQRLGDDIVTWRKLQRLTAAQVADRAGINVKTLRALEHGEGSVSIENALRVARALGVLEAIARSIDPYATDVGRLRNDEQLPTRVRPPQPRRG